MCTILIINLLFPSFSKKELSPSLLCDPFFQDFTISAKSFRIVILSCVWNLIRVRVELKAETAFAEYNSFYIAGEEDKYKIHLSGYSGTAGYP